MASIIFLNNRPKEKEQEKEQPAGSVSFSVDQEWFETLSKDDKICVLAKVHKWVNDEETKDY